MKLRDFDFRIWSKKENKYINKDCYVEFAFDANRKKDERIFLTNYVGKGEVIDSEHSEYQHSLLECDDSEIELFTGVCDRLGYKIYEGDIIGFENTGDFIRGDYLNATVVYNKDKAMFDAIINDGKEVYTIPMLEVIRAIEPKCVEKVGNVHYHDPHGGIIRTKG